MLIIETIECEAGHKDTIETDDREILEESKAKFLKEHKDCVKK